jgi:hypothetical protein
LWNPARKLAAGSDPGRATSPYQLYPKARPHKASDNPRPSSSQPTGCAGRRLASTAPTVAALTAATTWGTLPRCNQVSSGKPAWRSS